MKPSENLESQVVTGERETFGSNFAFILSCVGGAIGLGNLWGFPWRLGEYGGAAFLVPYLIIIIVLGITGLVEEYTLGRVMQGGPITSIEKVFKEKKLPFGAVVGTIPVLGGLGLFVFYAIVVGWVLRYLWLAVSGGLIGVDTVQLFDSFAGTSQSVFWHFLAIALGALIVVRGVKGIAKANKIMMPALFVMLIICAIRSVTLTGAIEGLKYLFVPDWSCVAKPITWVMALGQAFFSVSLGGASMIVYGSYLKKDADIPDAAVKTAGFDTLVALLAAFVMIPAVFAFGLEPTSGSSLAFISLPKVLASMKGGYIFGVLTFLCLAFAAMSTVAALMEIGVNVLMERANIDRTKGTILTALAVFLVGLPLDFSMARFGAWADFVTIYIIPISAVLSAIVFFWIYGGEKALAAANEGAAKPLKKWFVFIGKYVFVFGSIVVVILGIIYKGIG